MLVCRNMADQVDIIQRDGRVPDSWQGLYINVINDTNVSVLWSGDSLTGGYLFPISKYNF